MSPNLTYSLPPTASGLALQQYYDSFDLKHRWQKGYRIDWLTGQSIRPANNPHSTHCSAFVAHVLQQQHIYLLRPPEHPLKLLANAQWDYLQSPTATQAGWLALNNDYEHIQDMANQGYFVVAVVKNRQQDAPGHIALIYPMAYQSSDIQTNGPYVIQAGSINDQGISLIKGFSHHRKDLDKLKFYYYQQPFTKTVN